MARPAIEFTEKDLRQIEMLAGLGLTLPKIAAIMGFSVELLEKRKRTHEELNTVLERGRAAAEARVGKSLFERAIEGDVAAIRWWEMTRAGRTVEQRTENRNITTTTVTVKAPDWTALLGATTDAP